MPDPVSVPDNFDAVVFTPPARVHHEDVRRIQHAVNHATLSNHGGHRIVHMQQVESIDSAAMAGLMTIFQIAEGHGRSLVLCDPPPIVLAYLDIYDTNARLSRHVVYANEEGLYESDVPGFIPPFVPCAKGRFDVYRAGRHRSFEIRGEVLREVPAVALVPTPCAVPTRATRMQLRPAREEEVSSVGYTRVRRYECGPEAVPRLFSELLRLHRRYVGRAQFDAQPEVLVSDLPAGVLTERLSFRDRGAYEAFLKLAASEPEWQGLEPDMAFTESLFHVYRQA
jgi:anti-anti-sigma regulatory factor